jgi:hypothetical protein
MWGSWSLTSYLALGLVVAIVIALAVLASPLLAVIIAVLAAIPLFLIAAGIRRRSEGAEGSRDRPVTPEGKPTAPGGSRSGGAPASGEGEL